MGLLAFATLVGGSAMFTQQAWAANCDKVNIVYCGLSGSGVRGYIDSMRSHWNNSQPADFRAIGRWGGWTAGTVAGMNPQNTKVGTLDANTGAITVDGRVVARNTHMSARFNGGNGFYVVKEGVWARPITVKHEYSSYKVLVTFDASGKALAGVAVDCGNILKFTPTEPPKPEPQPELACESLTATKVSGARNYRFEAMASAKNTTIRNFQFDFGDSKTERVVTAARKANITHAYAETGKTYTARVYVNSTDKKDVTGPNCVVRVTIPKEPTPQKNPSVSIEKSVSKSQVAINEEFTYTVKVTNNGDVVLKNVVVTDEAPELVEFISASVGTATKDSWKHTIPELAVGQSLSFTIRAKATATSDSIVNTACVDAPEVPGNEDDCDDATINVPKTPVVVIQECKPGIPEDDERCDGGEVLGETTETTDAEELPDTGASSAIALITLVVLAGTSAHYLFRNGMPKFNFNKYDN